MMYAKLSREKIESLDYRRGRLGAQTERIERLLSGRTASLLPLVRTKSGAHSETKTRDLIEKLLAALEHAEARPLPERDREFYRGFLYCAIRAAAERPFWIVETRASFDDILRLGARVWPQDPVELYFTEMYYAPVLDGFFGCMDELYGALSGQSIVRTLGPAERAAVRERHPEEVEGIESQWKEMEEARAMAAEDLAELLTEDDLEEPDEWELREERMRQEWIDAFAEKETFCEQYLLCRALYFELAPGDTLPDRLRRMLDVYFAERNASGFLDDDAYFTAYALLDETLRRVKALLGESS